MPPCDTIKKESSKTEQTALEKDHREEEASQNVSSREQGAEASDGSRESAPLSGPGDLTLKNGLCSEQIHKENQKK